MTVNEAFELISNVTPCWDCRYKNSSCNRKNAHAWTDGFCHEFEEAISVLAEIIPVTEPESEPEPEPQEPNEGD